MSILNVRGTWFFNVLLGHKWENCWRLLLFSVRYHSIEHLCIFSVSTHQHWQLVVVSPPPPPHLLSHTLLFNCSRRVLCMQGQAEDNEPWGYLPAEQANEAHVLTNWLISAQQPIAAQASISCLRKMTNHHMSGSVMATCTELAP